VGVVKGGAYFLSLQCKGFAQAALTLCIRVDLLVLIEHEL
jgi:hypothetical protein